VFVREEMAMLNIKKRKRSSFYKEKSLVGLTPGNILVEEREKHTDRNRE
jgi:hypothetical protein